MSVSREKDAAWRRYKQVRSLIKDAQCTRTQMQRPTEENVQKHIREIKSTERAAKELKRLGRFLGENTNLEKYRRG